MDELNDLQITCYPGKANKSPKLTLIKRLHIWNRSRPPLWLEAASNVSPFNENEREILKIKYVNQLCSTKTHMFISYTKLKAHCKLNKFQTLFGHLNKWSPLASHIRVHAL